MGEETRPGGTCERGRLPVILSKDNLRRSSSSLKESKKDIAISSLVMLNSEAIVLSGVTGTRVRAAAAMRGHGRAVSRSGSRSMREWDGTSHLEIFVP
jgi:hypothetical protein